MEQRYTRVEQIEVETGGAGRKEWRSDIKGWGRGKKCGAGRKGWRRGIHVRVEQIKVCRNGWGM